MNANHESNDTPENVVTLGVTKPDAKSATELEMKRKIFQRAAEIMVSSLEQDALSIEKSAVVGEHTIQRRHELMDTARCLRVTITWIMGPQPGANS